MRSRLRFSCRRVFVVAFVAASLQGLHLAEGRRDPTFDAPIVDAGVYHEAAVAFAHGEPLIDDAFWQPPLLPMFLGGVYRVFGPNILAARIALGVLGVLSCLLIQGLGCRLFSERVGLVAGLMAATYGPFLFYSTRLLPVGPAIFWLRCLDVDRWHRWLCFGLVVGLATITVPNSIVLLVPALVWPALCMVRRCEVRRSVAACALVLVGTVMPIGAVTARNYAVSGEFVPISTNGGINFYIGNNARSDETLAIRPGEPWKRFARQSCRDGATTRAEQSRYFFRRTLDEMGADPAGFLGGLCRKTLLLLNGREVPRNVDPYVFRDFSPLLSVLMWRIGAFSFPFGLLAPLAVVGLVGSFAGGGVDERLRRRRMGISACVLVYGVSIVLFFVSGRYRLPMAMGLIVFAAAGLLALWSRLVSVVSSRRSETRVGRTTIAALMVALVVVNLPRSAPTDGHDFRAELNMSVGQSRARRGDSSQAESFLRRALDESPQYGAAAAALAGVLLHRGEIEPALELLGDTIRSTPPSVEARLVLADWYRRQGQPDEAASHFEAVLTLDDTSPDAHAGLADVLLSSDRAVDAIQHYRSALRFAEVPGPIELRLGDALVQTGAYEEAIERYRRALWRVDADAETLNRVAWLLATCPRIELRDCEQAIRLAEQVCRMTDHGNAAALDTLAAAYAECGRFSEAVTWVKAAIDLSVNADDPAAVEAFRARLRLYVERLGRDVHPRAGGP